MRVYRNVIHVSRARARDTRERRDLPASTRSNARATVRTLVVVLVGAPVLLLALAFVAGVVVGWALLAALPWARHTVRRQAEQLQTEAIALEGWRDVADAWKAPAVKQAAVEGRA